MSVMHLARCLFLGAATAASTLPASAQERPWTGLLSPSGSPRTMSAVSAPVAPSPAQIFGARPVPTVAPRVAAPPRIDESALRYYASQNDSARVAAEIRRLRTLYPAWQPPADLYDQVADGPEQQRLWQLFADKRFEEIRALVEEQRLARPDWRPSEDFVRKFEQAEVRHYLVLASDAKDFQRVLGLAQLLAESMSCADVDVLWRVGEALAGTNDGARAQDLYTYILSQCSDAGERMATLQKAALVLPPDAIDRLLAMGRRKADGTNEFDTVRLDILRGRIGAIASGTLQGDIEASRLKDFEEKTRNARAAGDAELLGWYRYARKEPGVAEQWFRQAHSWRPTAKTTEGIALALREQGDVVQAEALTYQGRGDALLRKLYIELMQDQLTKPAAVALPADRVSRFGAVVNEAQSASGAAALGWYAYNQGQVTDAREWFVKARTWQESEDAILGLALSENRLKNRVAFVALVRDYESRYPAVAALKPLTTQSRGGAPGRGAASGANQAQVQKVITLFENGRYQEAIHALDKSRSSDYGLQVVKGWALYKMGRADLALEHFDALNQRRPSTEAREGRYYARQMLIPRYLYDNP